MRHDRKAKAQKFQEERVEAAKMGMYAAGGVGALGLSVDSLTGEPGQGMTVGEMGSNALLGAVLPGSAVAGALIGRKSAYSEGAERAKKIKARKPDSLEGEFKQRADFQNNKERTQERMQTRGARGAAIGAAAMLVPVLMASRDNQQLANQSASLM